MAYAFVGQAQNVTNGNTVTYSPTVGNFLVVVSGTSAGSGAPTASIADNASGVWSTGKVTHQDGAVNNDFFSVFYQPVAATGITVTTITYVGGTPGNTNIAIIEFSGLSATGWQGISTFNEQTAPGTGANLVVSNSFNVTTQPALLLGWSFDTGGNGGWTAGTSPLVFTRRVNGNFNMVEDTRVTATGNAIATATNTHAGADTFISYVMAISEPAAGGSPPLLGQICL